MQKAIGEAHAEPLTFLFVYDPPQLDFQARILAASLRAQHGDAVSIIAGAPSDASAFNPYTLDLFAHLNVEVVRFAPTFFQTFKNGRRYRIGNKIDLAVSARRGGTVVLCDTDLMALSPFEVPAGEFGAAAVAETAQSVALFKPPGAEELHAIYRREGCHAVSERVLLADGESESLPYFNSGCVVIRDPGLAQAWSRLTHDILDDESIPRRYRFPYSDQIALSVLSQSPRFAFLELPRRYNRFRPFFNRASDRTVMWHYHVFGQVLSSPQAVALLREIEETLLEGFGPLLPEVNLRKLDKLLSRRSGAGAPG